jgi:hypothetical protein
MNAMASLYVGISETGFLRPVHCQFSSSLLSKNEFGLITGDIARLLKIGLKSFKANGHTKTKKVNHGDLRDDRPTHGRSLASDPH